MTQTGDGFYDDCGRWWPDDAEWCDLCQGMGMAECQCGGDQCYCENYGEMECPRCDGEGYFVPTAAFKAAREQNAKWWRELHEWLAQGIEARSGATACGRDPKDESPVPAGDAPGQRGEITHD